MGLYRTEYLFLNAEHLPDEDQQFAAYGAVAQGLAPLPVLRPAAMKASGSNWPLSLRYS